LEDALRKLKLNLDGQRSLQLIISRARSSVQTTTIVGFLQQTPSTHQIKLNTTILSQGVKRSVHKRC